MGEGNFNPENTDKKSEIDKDFLLSVEIADNDMVYYTELRDEIKRRELSLNKMEAKIKKLRESGEVGTEEFMEVLGAIDFLKREIANLKENKKKTAKDMEKVIQDPRWHILQFDEFPEYSPSNEDN